MTRVLTRTDLQEVLTLQDCIGAVEQAFRDYDTGRLPKSESLGVRAREGTFHVKAAQADVFAAKINANFPANPKRHGLPTIQGLIIVMDLERGTPLAILDSALITTLRTAAATAVAAKYLARPDARTAAIIGCGAQGRATAHALRVVLPIQRVRLWDVDGRVMAAAAAELQRAPAEVNTVETSSLEEAADGADIIVTCTPAVAPFLEPRHVRPGTFIAAVGADNPQKCEISSALMKQSRIVPDLLEQSALMGDLRQAIAAGVLTRHDVHGELGAIVSGRTPGRRDSNEIFIFDSTGTALQDVVVASLAVERAAARGLGSSISIGA